MRYLDLIFRLLFTYPSHYKWSKEKREWREKWEDKDRIKEFHQKRQEQDKLSS